LCGRGKARRACPALGRDICAVCCATKRETEIRCPPDCGYLTSARAHPPAVVQRQQERDLDFVASLVDGLTQVQSELFLFLQATIAGHAPGQLPPVLDTDVAEAAAAAASTSETHTKGIIYEHPVSSVPAQRLVAAIKAGIDDVLRHGGQDEAPTRLHRDLAAALRRIERGARTAAAALGEAGRETTFLELSARLLRDVPRARDSEVEDEGIQESVPGSRIILP
jgi:hypothetical protein